MSDTLRRQNDSGHVLHVRTGHRIDGSTSDRYRSKVLPALLTGKHADFHWDDVQDSYLALLFLALQFFLVIAKSILINKFHLRSLHHLLLLTCNSVLEFVAQDKRYTLDLFC